MNENIWRVLTQILDGNNDLIKIIKPFFENLKNNNINDEKYISFLKSLPKEHLEVLYQYEIITEGKFKLLMPNNEIQYKFLSDSPNEKIHNHIEKIISEDNIEELRTLIEIEGTQTFNMIKKSFREVKKMKIPLIQYCIMKKAIKCFKYLLVNGLDDPQKNMLEQNPKKFFDPTTHNSYKINRYEWNLRKVELPVSKKGNIKWSSNKEISYSKIRVLY